MPIDAEMPRYKCHKEVWALKIKTIQVDHPACQEDGAALLTPADTTYAPFTVSSAYVEKHKPQEGGYFVVYQDGYKSFSPAAAFESGYSLVQRPGANIHGIGPDGRRRSESSLHVHGLTMQPHEKRVIDECDELGARITRLAVFTDGDPRFNALVPAERERMRMQLLAMRMYEAILRQRIAAFTPDRAC